jgi:hypothetical protein
LKKKLLVYKMLVVTFLAATLCEDNSQLELCLCSCGLYPMGCVMVELIIGSVVVVKLCCGCLN